MHAPVCVSSNVRHCSQLLVLYSFLHWAHSSSLAVSKTAGLHSTTHPSSLPSGFCTWLALDRPGLHGSPAGEGPSAAESPWRDPPSLSTTPLTGKQRVHGRAQRALPPERPPQRQGASQMTQNESWIVRRTGRSVTERGAPEDTKRKGRRGSGGDTTYGTAARKCRGSPNRPM